MTTDAELKDRKSARMYPISDVAPGEHIGTVTAIGFTEGGMGNQWTVIDGKRYVTYWDFRNVNWRIGDLVCFTVRHRPFGWHNHGTPPPWPHAENIQLAE